MLLREYQTRAVEEIRLAFKKYKRVFYQLPTGSGKTIIFSQIAKQAKAKGTIVWIMVPRRELKKQASNKLSKLEVPHGIISPGFTESTLYTVHIVSKDTWIRRKDKIKTPPKLIIVDEGHLSINRYIELQQIYPNAYYLFVSATPERLDGRGLNEIADVLITGPSMKFMIEHEYLAPMKCYCPPINGLKDLRRHGTEYNQDDLEAFLNHQKLYGKAIEHYKTMANKEPCIVFCRSVKLAEQAAYRFQEAGFKFASIDGSMANGERDRILSDISTGQLDGVTSCELITYGLDVPKVSCIIMLRPTKSRALFYQMIGRGSRYEDGKVLKIFDHAGNMREHCSDKMPWDPVQWNFNGRNIYKKETIASIKYCPYIGFAPCSKKTCLGCEFNTTNKPITDFEEIDGKLIEINKSVDIKGRPVEEKIFYQRRVEDLKLKIISGEVINTKALEELLELASETGRNPMWVYYLCCDNWKIIFTPLLNEIKRIKGYKDGWVFHQVKTLSSKLNIKVSEHQQIQGEI